MLASVHRRRVRRSCLLVCVSGGLGLLCSMVGARAEARAQPAMVGAAEQAPNVLDPGFLASSQQHVERVGMSLDEIDQGIECVQAYGKAVFFHPLRRETTQMLVQSLAQLLESASVSLAVQQRLLSGRAQAVSAAIEASSNGGVLVGSRSRIVPRRSRVGRRRSSTAPQRAQAADSIFTASID